MTKLWIMKIETSQSFYNGLGEVKKPVKRGVVIQAPDSETANQLANDYMNFYKRNASYGHKFVSVQPLLEK